MICVKCFNTLFMLTSCLISIVHNHAITLEATFLPWISARLPGQGHMTLNNIYSLHTIRFQSCRPLRSIHLHYHQVSLASLNQAKLLTLCLAFTACITCVSRISFPFSGPTTVDRRRTQITHVHVQTLFRNIFPYFITLTDAGCDGWM